MLQARLQRRDDEIAELRATLNRRAESIHVRQSESAALATLVTAADEMYLAITRALQQTHGLVADDRVDAAHPLLEPTNDTALRERCEAYTRAAEQVRQRMTATIAHECTMQ